MDIEWPTSTMTTSLINRQCEKECAQHLSGTSIKGGKGKQWLRLDMKKQLG